MKIFAIILGLFCTSAVWGQKHALLLDVTQTSLLSPMLVYNIYSPLQFEQHTVFMQIGVGGQMAVSKHFLHYSNRSDPYYENTYEDNKSFGSYSGATLRLGFYTGKMKSRFASKLVNTRLMYAGVGAQIKYVTNSNMRVSYQKESLKDGNKSYRFQGENTFIAAPFFNAGIQMCRNKVVAEWYAGFQTVFKFRNKTISKEFVVVNDPYTVSEKGPYTEQEVNTMPALVLGFRLGSLLK